MSNARPTRAEVADIANAIHDGTDALMLSGETAAGRYPIEAAATMARVAAKTDEVIAQGPIANPGTPEELAPKDTTFAHAIGQAASHTAEDVRAKCITCFTMSGYSARMISRYRPRKPVIAITANEDTRRRCALYWGVQTLLGTRTESLNNMVIQVDDILTREGLARDGDTVVIVAGTPLLVGGRTNILKIHRVGEEDTEERRRQ